jgi:hypothetical protein
MDHRVAVQKWLSGYLGRSASAIDSEDILGSLGIEGDDADELLEAFATQFKVDMSALNPWHHYNADEPPNFRRYRAYSTEGNVLSDLQVSVADLASAAASGRWMKDYSGRELRRSNVKHIFFLILAAIIAFAVIMSVIT